MDNRLFVNGVLSVLRSRAHWCDLPERYGQWKTAHKRFSRWSKAGVWDRVFADLIKDRDNQYLMIDSTLVRAHQQAATGKGASNQALGRSGGGLTTKIHMAADTFGRPLRFILTAGDAPAAPALIAHDIKAYRARNCIERCFSKLKHFRRFATRYNRRAVHFLGFIHLATAMIWMR